MDFEFRQSVKLIGETPCKNLNISGKECVLFIYMYSFFFLSASLPYFFLFHKEKRKQKKKKKKGICKIKFYFHFQVNLKDVKIENTTTLVGGV